MKAFKTSNVFVSFQQNVSVNNVVKRPIAEFNLHVKTLLRDFKSALSMASSQLWAQPRAGKLQYLISISRK
jgi:hypothetical protein